MGKKWSLLLLLFAVVSLLSVGIVEATVRDQIVLAVGVVQDFIGNYEDYHLIFDGMVVFILVFSVFLIGGRRSLNGVSGADKAIQAVAFAVALTAGAGFAYYENSIGTTLLQLVGPLITAAIVGGVFLLFGYAIIHIVPENHRGYAFASLAVVGYFFFVSYIPPFQKFLDRNEGIMLIINVVFLACVVVMLLGVWQFLSYVWRGTRQPLSQQELNQEEAYETQKELREARGAERTTTKDLRIEASKIKEAKDILAGLAGSIVREQKRGLTGRWTVGEGQIAKLERLQVGIGGYVGLVSILAEKVQRLPAGNGGRRQDINTRLNAARSNIININRQIGNRMPSLLTGARATPPAWANLSAGVGQLDNWYTELQRWMNAVVALEREVRLEIGRLETRP